jgi:hypothetical protein
MADKLTCLHERLHWGSGGYYVHCMDCFARWAYVSNDRSEYGIELGTGREIGADPVSAPKHLSGMIRGSGL